MRLIFLVSICLLASAEVSVAKGQSECSKDFKWYYAKYLTDRSQHYAVATFNGEPLKAHTVCAFAGQPSKKLSEAEALRICNKGLKKYGRTGKCKVIKSR